jgi:hypothetical protein
VNEEQQSSENVSHPDATNPDLSRQAATGDDIISIKEARQIFLAHERAITERTLQRYCEKNYLSGQKRIIDGNENWFVLKSSVLTRIAELDEFDKHRQPKTRRDMSPSVAEENKENFYDDTRRQDATEKLSPPVINAQQSQTTTDDKSRPVATRRDSDTIRETSARDAIDMLSARERELLEREIDQLKRESDLKDRIIERYEIENGGLRGDKEKLYALLDSANHEKLMLIEGDRDSKAVMKNNNSLIGYLAQLFKGKGELPNPTGDASYPTANLTDVLAGDERAN